MEDGQALGQGEDAQCRDPSRNLAEERFLTLARKADELAVANATQAPEVRLAGPAMTSDRLPWARYLVWLASAVGLGLLLGLIWVLAVRPRAD